MKRMIEINMKMPEKCGLCPCFHFENPIHCQAVRADKDRRIVNPYGSPRPEWCPLKEQEAVEPTINEYGNAYCICGENVGIIPNSKNLPKVCLKYCPECGRRMKWE